MATAERTAAVHLSVSPERQGVVPLPGLSAACLRLVVAMALVETPRTLPRRRQAAGFAVLVDRVDDPADARVPANGGVLRVDKDHLVVLVRRVLVDPVRVQHAEVGAAAADTLLGRSAEGALVLELVHTLVGRLAWTGERNGQKLSPSSNLGG